MSLIRLWGAKKLLRHYEDHYAELKEMQHADL